MSCDFHVTVMCVVVMFCVGRVLIFAVLAVLAAIFVRVVLASH